MTNDDWINRLHDRLENQTAEPPEGLWENIEASLNKQRRQVRLLWVRRFAAATVVSGVIVMGTMLYLNDKSAVNTTKIDNGTALTASSESTKNTVEEPLPISEQIKNIVSSRQDNKLLAYAQENNSNENDLPKSLYDDAKEPISTSERASLDTSKSLYEKAEETKSENNSKPTQYKKSSDLSTGEAWTIGKTTRSEQQKWAVGAHTTGVFANENSVNGLMMANEPILMAAKQANDVLMASHVQDQRYEKTEHHQPIQVGLTASYALSDRVSLTSGVVYTKASSDFIRVTGNTEMVDKQNLHYVGIPVSASYKIWQTKRFKTYVAAGGQADFNVSATVETEGVKADVAKDRVQWSVNAAAGAQYDVVPQVGVYVEPGVKYYIDNRSDVENVFKSRPCSFSLQVGVRLNIK